MDLGVESASNINENQGYSYGLIAAGWCDKADNLTAICEPNV
jgi:hypothetical protein